MENLENGGGGSYFVVVDEKVAVGVPVVGSGGFFWNSKPVNIIMGIQPCSTTTTTTTTTIANISSVALNDASNNVNIFIIMRSNEQRGMRR